MDFFHSAIRVKTYGKKTIICASRSKAMTIVKTCCFFSHVLLSFFISHLRESQNVQNVKICYVTILRNFSKILRKSLFLCPRPLIFIKNETDMKN